MATTLSHSNIWLHRMLTDQGACVHEHEPESFEDDGDGESGPHLIGGPAYDRYTSESHYFIIDSSGTIVHSEPIDWDLWRFCEEQASNDAGPEDWPASFYVRKRGAGEDWQVCFRDEDGIWWSQHGNCWTEDRREAHFFTLTEAEQIALRFRNEPHDRITGTPQIVEQVNRG